MLHLAIVWGDRVTVTTKWIFDDFWQVIEQANRTSFCLNRVSRVSDTCKASAVLRCHIGNG